MPNPSFEEATLPGWPDYYNLRTPGLAVAYHLGTPGSQITLDLTNPFHGKCALKVTSAVRGLSYVSCLLDLKGTAPGEYVLSFYARADKDGFKVSPWAFGKIDDAHDDFALTTEWKRYRVSGKLPLAGTTTWGVTALDIGTFWLDGIQLEEGSEPTAFEP